MPGPWVEHVVAKWIFPVAGRTRATERLVTTGAVVGTVTPKGLLALQLPGTVQNQRVPIKFEPVRLLQRKGRIGRREPARRHQRIKASRSELPAWQRAVEGQLYWQGKRYFMGLENSKIEAAKSHNRLVLLVLTG